MKTEAKARKRTQEERREESERKLYDALIEIVIKEGINAATCENIGKAAGYSRGLTTTRLGRKEEMFANLINRLKKAQLDKLKATIDKNMSRTEALKAYINIHFDDLRDSPGYNAYFVLVAGSLTDSPLLREPVIDANEFVRNILTNLIKDGVKTGEFSSELDPAASAITIGSYLLGVAIQHRLHPSLPIELLKEGAHALIPPTQCA